MGNFPKKILSEIPKYLKKFLKKFLEELVKESLENFLWKSYGEICDRSMHDFRMEYLEKLPEESFN